MEDTAMNLKSHHSSFPVRDAEISKAFYGDVLGLTEIPRPPRLTFPGAWYLAGPCEVHLIQAPEGVDVGPIGSVLTPFARHMAFAVESLEAAKAHLTAKGVAIMDIPGAVGQFWIHDPDGHVLEFIEARG
jgi:glyoxylase I family protein